MGRPVILGNGAMTVGLNEHGLVHDFYYPYVGLDNLTNARSVHHMLGVWVDGQFSWVDDESWDIDVDFYDDALVSKVKMVHSKLKVTLSLEDFVDSDINLFGRQINVTNDAADEREIRVFTHQVFEISRDGRADTALFVPRENYILDYKGRCSLLIYGITDDNQPYDQFAIGNHGIDGKEGTFRDAEDGELSGSTIEHGGVDSVMRFTKTVEAHKSYQISYWIIAADSQQNAEKLHNSVKKHGLQARIESTRSHWQKWLSKASDNLKEIDPKYLSLTKKSLMIIKTHTDKRGGIIAGVDSSIYNYGRDYYSYVWPRDGAYAIWPLIRMGFRREAKLFFEFCRDILSPGGYLMHKFQPDRAIGSTWHPLIHKNQLELAIQEDETASVVFMLGEYYEHFGDEDFVRSLYKTFVQPTANFMAGFIDDETNLPHASYDLWEEKFLTATYSTAVTYQALLTAAEFAEKFEHPDDAVVWKAKAELLLKNRQAFVNPDTKQFRKGFYMNKDEGMEYDDTIDISSLYGSFMYDYFMDEPQLINNNAAVVKQRLSDDTGSGGGVARYDQDNYFRAEDEQVGNPWFVGTLWLAQYYIRAKQSDKAREMLDWTMKHTLSSGVLSEQINSKTHQQISVAPLVWSHAEFINTVLDLSKTE